MHPLSEQLASAYMSTFASADREITWLAAEEERSLWLTPHTVLVGRVDARGLTADRLPFFAEFKSMSNYRARYMDDEKLKWRTNPQALTYGVLLSDLNIDRFTVRWAIKPNPKAKVPVIACDFEWYTYTPAEVAHWRHQLIDIACDIRNDRTRPPTSSWRTNFDSCFKYGVQNTCPFFDRCTKQEWSRPMDSPRIPHLQIEPAIRAEKSLDTDAESLVILDASRVGDYLACPESYRRTWEGEGFQETSEALTIGIDFHSAVAEHIKGLIKENTNVVA